jgi:hypothetical protein
MSYTEIAVLPKSNIIYNFNAGVIYIEIGLNGFFNEVIGNYSKMIIK